MNKLNSYSKSAYAPNLIQSADPSEFVSGRISSKSNFAIKKVQSPLELDSRFSETQNPKFPTPLKFISRDSSVDIKSRTNSPQKSILLDNDIPIILTD